MKASRFYALLAVLLFATPCLAGTRDLREDTTYASSPGPIVVGPFVDGTGAPLTSLAVGSIEVKAYKNDGTAVNITPAASGTDNDMAHVNDGYYSLELTSSDTSTPGYLRLTFQISNALIFHEDFNVLPANIYDSKYGSDLLQVDAMKVNHVATSSVSTISANLGTTQPVNFTGTGSNALVKCDVTAISTDNGAADNAEAYYDGSGFGPLIMRSTISSVTSQTQFAIAGDIEDAEHLIGCYVVIRGSGSPTNKIKTGIVTAASNGSGINLTIALTYGGTPTLYAEVGDIVDVLPPGFYRQDRNDLASILDDTGNSGVKLASAAITAAKFDGSTAFAQSGDAYAVVNNGTYGNSALKSAIDAGVPVSSLPAIPTDWITAAGLKADAVTKVGDGVLDNDFTDNNAADTFGYLLNNPVDLGAAIAAELQSFFNNATSFAAAIDDHGYTTARAEKIDQLAPTLLLNTTISGTPSSQTSLVLAEGPSHDDALNGAIIIVTSSDPTQKAVGLIKDYDQATKTVTLVADPGIFTFDNGDIVDVIAGGPAVPLWLSGQ